MILVSGVLRLVAGQADDAVNSLPGANISGLKINSGYVPVEPKHGGKLFYLMFESQSKPSTGCTCLAPSISYPLHICISRACNQVPAIADHLLQTSSPLRLAGIGLGDGWTDPLVQTKTNADYLRLHNRIGNDTAVAYNAQYPTYKALIDATRYEAATELGNLMLEEIVVAGHVGDVYDIRKSSDPTDPLSDALQKYFNKNADVRAALHADKHWDGCSVTPGLALIHDEEQSMISHLPNILAHGRVLLYNGGLLLFRTVCVPCVYADPDIKICNWLGTQAWAEDIDWPHRQEFNASSWRQWKVGSNAVGQVRAASNLTFVKVFDAGHMSPYDQRTTTHEMLLTFLSARVFGNVNE
eukprot:gene8173-1459_t